METTSPNPFMKYSYIEYEQPPKKEYAVVAKEIDDFFLPVAVAVAVPVPYTLPKITTAKAARPVKRKIPKVVKDLVWKQYVGKDVNTCSCLCCERNEISYMNFHVGHVVSERDGGTDNIANLRPICSACNSSMGTRNLFEFKRQYF
jgi:hypothetical protein